MMEVHGNISKKKGFESQISNTELDYIVGKLENLFFATKVIQALQDEGVYKNTEMWEDIGQILVEKVDKEAGKGLSSNDFTDEEKNKLKNAVNNINALFEALDGKADVGDLLSGLLSKVDVNAYNAKITELVNAIAQKAEKLTFDTVPTAGSGNPVTSGGIKTELDKKVNAASDRGTVSLVQNAGGYENGYNIVAHYPSEDRTLTVLTKTYIDEELLGKANADEVYTKEEADTQINNKLSNVYKYKGSVNDFDFLSEDDIAYNVSSVVGNVYNYVGNKAEFTMPMGSHESFYNIPIYEAADTYFIVGLDTSMLFKTGQTVFMSSPDSTGEITITGVSYITHENEKRAKISYTSDGVYVSTGSNLGFTAKVALDYGDNVAVIDLNGKPYLDKMASSIDLSGYQEKLEFDTAPALDSENPVTSDGIYKALSFKFNTSGGSITGDLTIAPPNHITAQAAPANDNHLVNKGYIDGELLEYVKKTDVAVQNSGIPGLINLGSNSNGIYISNNELKVYGVSKQNIDAKVSNTMPVCPRQIDNAAKASTHQEMSDDYDVSTFFTSADYKEDKGNLPVSYNAVKGYVDGMVGDIETALDGIIALQNSYIGGSGGSGGEIS